MERCEMRAREAYRLIVRRRGLLPAMLASHDRMDHIELVDIGSGEVVLFWDCDPQRASLMARMLREELRELEAEEFIDRWRAVD